VRLVEETGVKIQVRLGRPPTLESGVSALPHRVPQFAIGAQPSHGIE
jgi:hypothetical protein